MGMTSALAGITDPYERKARLWPALLALLPLIVTVSLLYGPKASALAQAIMVTVACGGTYLLANISREWGRRLEPALFESWGGKPTTQLLRHRDSTIEQVTKQRYHSFLATKIKSPFPTPSEEVAAPSAADEIYQSAVRWLLNQTRDTAKFRLLFNENVSYGFRRNALALKPVGITVALLCAAWALVAGGVVSTTGPVFNTATVAVLPETATASLLASAGMLVTWAFFFTRESARNTAFAYAEQLLRSCDLL